MNRRYDLNWKYVKVVEIDKAYLLSYDIFKNHSVSFEKN